MQTIKILLLVIVTAGLPQKGECEGLFCYQCPQMSPQLSEAWNCTFSEAEVVDCGSKGCLVGMHPDFPGEKRRYGCWHPAVDVVGCNSEPNALGYRKCLCNTDCCNTWVDLNDKKGPNLNGCNGNSFTITASVSTTVSTVITTVSTVTGKETEELKSELVKSGVSGNKYCSALQFGAAMLSILILLILTSLF